MEGGRSGKRECRGKEMGSASAAPSACLQSRLWISMLLMKSADVEGMYRSKCVCVWVENKNKRCSYWSFPIVCSLCNMSATLFRPLSYSNFSVATEAWRYCGRTVMYSFSTVVGCTVPYWALSWLYSVLFFLCWAECISAVFSKWVEGLCWQVRTTRCLYLMGRHLARCWCWVAGILLLEVSREQLNLKFNLHPFFRKCKFFKSYCHRNVFGLAKHAV